MPKHSSIIQHEEEEITDYPRESKHNQEQEDLICPEEKVTRILMVFSIRE